MTPRNKSLQRYNISQTRHAGLVAVLGTCLMTTGVTAAFGDERDVRVRLLEKTVQDLLARDERREARMRHLEREVQRLRGKPLARAGTPTKRTGASGGGAPAPRSGQGHDHAGHDHGDNDRGGHGHSGHDRGGQDDGARDVWSARVGDGTLRLRRIGIDADMAFGFGTGNQETISTLFGGGHDPNRNGFTLRSVDFSIAGSFDPYFDARMTAVFFIDAEGETRIELEEAFLQTKRIAGFLRLRGGLFLTPFGVFNQTHAHDQDWLTQPVILTRLMGEDGLRGVGAAAIFDLPVPWKAARLSVGIQNARGETQYSFLSSDEAFEERPIGGLAFTEREVNGLGAMTYFVRLENAFALSKALGLSLGASAVFGPNATGSGGRTTLFGFDATLILRTASLGSFTWRTEFAQRIFGVDRSQREAIGGRPSLVDYGLYTQVLWRFHPKWGVGLRYEYASGRGQSGGDYADRGEDPFRGDRHRLAPIVYWQFATYGRATVQYTYDHANFLSGDKNAHALWVGLRWSFGLGTGHAHIDDHNHGHAH